jgi:phosphoenolpyruvate-protein kinase (PTS system EI component)
MRILYSFKIWSSWILSGYQYGGTDKRRGCLGNVGKHLVSQMEALDDEYLRARAEDICDVSQWVLRPPAGVREPDVSKLTELSLVVVVGS